MRVRQGGKPVTDLRAEDLTLLVDGKPRTITSLIYSPVVVPAKTGPNAFAGTGPPPPSALAGAAPARRLVFVVDRDSIAPGEARQLQKTTEDFIRRVPGTIATAVATLPLESELKFDPDRSTVVNQLRTAFEGTTRRGSGFEGIAGFGCSDDAASEGCGNQGIHPAIPAGPARETNRTAEWTLRGRRTLTDLQRLFRTLTGTPADVVIISAGLPFYEGRTSGRRDDPFPEGVTSDMRADIDRTFAVARSAGTRVHAVEIRELTRAALPEGGNPESLDLAALREKRPAGCGLPEETGGVAVTGAVSGVALFDRLAAELSSTYLLSFEPTEADRDGEPHAIELRTGRPSLTLVARKTFVAAPGASSSVPTPGSNAAGTVSPNTPTSRPQTPRPTSQPTPVEAWVALAQAHVPGQRDRQLVEVSQWNSGDLKKAIGGLRSWKRSASTDAVDDILLRGALLHTDLALLAPDLALGFDGFPEWATLNGVSTADGQARGTNMVSAHWRLARVLLENMPPRPQDNAGVLRWYRAVGAWLLENRLQAIAVAHLDEAQRLFPRDRDVNLLAGLLHESLARAAGWALLETGIDDSSELQAARRALQRTVDADPQAEVARLHLARVSHLLGDDQAASAAASVVLAQAARPANKYVAELLMGSIHQAAQRFDQARASFERSAALYPTAQSPLVALSQVARASGNRAEAVRSVERLTALPHDVDGRRDPWWEYESSAVRDFGPLLDDLRDDLKARRTR
jgi:VWFA-related protein